MQSTKSKKYRYWKSIADSRRCVPCEEKQGQIYLLQEVIGEKPPLHERCRCSIQYLDAKRVGTATELGLRGVDWWLKTFGRLPDYYLTTAEARQLGWKAARANLSIVAPGKMLAGGIYKNNDGHLPTKPGRVWYEADINYTFGHRGKGRVLYSNDGLIFVTYDHYETFVEII